jgi:hypothetical protein
LKIHTPGLPSAQEAAAIRGRMSGKANHVGPGHHPHPGATEILPGSSPSVAPALSPDEQKVADANKKLRAAKAIGKAFADSLHAAKELIRVTSDGA